MTEMTDKELKKLNRRELLEIPIAQARKNERLEKKIAELQQRLDAKELTVSEAGDLAGAVMELNGVFDAARNACDQYKINVERMEEECRRECERLREEAQQEAIEIVKQAILQAEVLLQKDRPAADFPNTSED